MSRKTHEEFVEEFNKFHISKKVTLIGKYVDSATKIEVWLWRWRLS